MITGAKVQLFSDICKFKQKKNDIFCRSVMGRLGDGDQSKIIKNVPKIMENYDCQTIGGI